MGRNFRTLDAKRRGPQTSGPSIAPLAARPFRPVSGVRTEAPRDGAGPAAENLGSEEARRESGLADRLQTKITIFPPAGPPSGRGAEDRGEPEISWSKNDRAARAAPPGSPPLAYRTAPQRSPGSGPVLQRKWKDYNQDVKVWDRLLGGLRWWFDTTTNQMSFEVIDLPEENPAYEELMALAGVSRPYEGWLKLWEGQGWIEQDSENDLSYVDENGQRQQWMNPDVPLTWEWWQTKALYRAELEPRYRPHYRQRGAQTCGVEAIRMTAEGRTGIPLDRNELMGLIDDRVMPEEIVNKMGLPLHTLPNVFAVLDLAAEMRTGVDLDTLEALVQGGATVLSEAGEHVVVVDAVERRAAGRFFTIRDPAGVGQEVVPDTDGRLLGTGRVVIVRGG